MPVDEPSSPPRRSAQTIALLAAVIAVPGLIGLSISFLQRPPQPPVSAPLPSPSPTPVAHGPVSGFGYSLVDDAAAQQVVFFGGIDSYEQTWLWDGGRWKLAAPRSHPPGRFGAAAAYDPVTTDVLLFGGRLAPGQLANDTWAWDGRTWRELDGGAEGPPPGEGELMAWDAA